MLPDCIGGGANDFSGNWKRLRENEPAMSLSQAARRADETSMIDLTRLNGHRMAVNCDLIKYVEAAPDTTLSLVTGEKLIVLESCDELMTRVRAYRSAVLRGAWPEACSALSAKMAAEMKHTAEEHGEAGNP